MRKRGLVAVVAVIGLVAIVGVSSAYIGIGPASSGFGGVFDGEESHPPALLSFDSDGVQCTEDFSTNTSTSVAAGGANTEITYARNVSLPGPSYTLGGPTFERQNDSTYVLSIPIEETDETPRECPGVVRYQSVMRIPAGDDPWRVIVDHDGETVTTIEGDSSSTSSGGSVSVGESVSDENRNGSAEQEP